MGKKSGIWVAHNRPWLGLKSELLRRTFPKKVEKDVKKRKSCLRIMSDNEVKEMGLNASL